jgi:hypothetical protein
MGDPEDTARVLRAKGYSDRDIMDLAWSIVRRENIELRREHARAYRWAMAYIDAHRRGGPARSWSKSGPITRRYVDPASMGRAKRRPGWQPPSYD